MSVLGCGWFLYLGLYININLEIVAFVIFELEHSLTCACEFWCCCLTIIHC